MFSTFIQQAWSDHGDDAEGVYARLPEGVDLAMNDEDRAKLASLVVHVAGQHLGRWHEGLAWLDQLAAADGHDPHSAMGRSLQRCRAALLLCAGEAESAKKVLDGAIDPERPDGSSRVRVLTLVAGALIEQGRTPEAAAAFRAALDAGAYGPDREDPAARALAIMGNNLASFLEEREDRDAQATALMKAAAHAGRRWWAVAGDWTNVVLAEVRLCHTHLQAGEPDRALGHALESLAMAEAHDAGPEDRLAPLMAITKSRRDCGEGHAARETLLQVQATLAAVDPDLRGWVAPFAQALADSLAP